MILFDILEMFDENKKLNVWDCGEPDNLLTFYDGRNSIDMIYNYCEVAKLSTHFDEYDNETVLDVYIKQDPQNICRGDIADYLRNEFEYSENEIKDEISGDIIGLAYTTNWCEKAPEFGEIQASYDIKTQTLIIETDLITRYIPTSYAKLKNCLDFGELTGLGNELYYMIYDPEESISFN